MSNIGMMAAVAAAAGLNSETPLTTVDAAFLATHFPYLVAGFRADGAQAERDRLKAIDDAALPGHEKLVADCKADSTKTAGDLALAIVAAERSARTSMLKSLDTDEARLKGLRPEPANGAVAAKPDDKPALTGEALWKSEFAASADLQADFGSEANYLALKRAEARGGVKVRAS